MNNQYIQSCFTDNLFCEKVFVVTGAGRGIGKAIASLLEALSATVVVLEHPDCASVNAGQNVVAVDLADSRALEICINNIVKDYGRCDGLVNNARAGQRSAPLYESADNIMQSVAVGLAAPTLLSQQLITYAATKPELPRAIVNISSTSAHRVSGESASYHATKSALESLTRYLAVYGGRHNVRVNAIAPGFIVKDEHVNRFTGEDNSAYRSTALAVHPLGRVGSVADVANMVAFLLSSASGFMTGQTLVVDGGLTLRDGFSNAMSLDVFDQESE